MTRHGKLLTAAFEAAWKQTIDRHDQDSLRHVNESVFRYFLVDHLRQRLDDGESCEDEWKRIDLLIRAKNRQTAVEMKFYMARPFHHLDGRRISYKGRASDGNYAEFVKSLTLLMELEKQDWYGAGRQGANITERYFLLVAVDRPNAKRRFETDYLPGRLVHQGLGYRMQFLVRKQQKVGELDVLGWLCRVTK